MNYISTTDLRTKSSKLVEALKNSETVSLIHRSQVVGRIEPMQETDAPPVNIDQLRALIRELKLKKLIPQKDRDKIYRKHLEEKYG